MNGEEGFALHPLTAQDILEIWQYIADDNPLAARRVREEIHNRIRELVSLPSRCLHKVTGVRTLHRVRCCSRGPRLFDCLRAEREALVGCGGNTWTPKPASSGRDFERKRMVSAN
jgi:plasmid stabilization system protein ParE